MTLDIVRMRARVRRPVGMTDVSDTDLTDTEIDEYLNHAFWEIQDKFPFREKERAGVFETIIGQRNYTMPANYEYLTNIALVDPVTGQHKPLDSMTADEYESLYVDDTIVATDQGPPQKYVREACAIRLWPTPDKVYSMWIRRMIVLADLSSINDTSPLPQVWTEILIYGAVYRALFDFGDISRGTTFKNLQASLINGITPVDAKELVDTSRAGLEVMGRTYDQEDEPQFSRTRMN